MKKLLVVLLLAGLALGLTGCGGEGAAVTGTGDDVGEEAREVISAREREAEEIENNWWTPPPRTADFTKLTAIPDAATGESLLVPDMWVTEHGAYYVNTVQPGMDGAYGGGGVSRVVSGGGRAVTSMEYGGMGMDMEYSAPITLVHIIDSATGKDMVLCNRVTCPHDSEDCGAFLPDDPSDPDDFNQWGFSARRGGWGGGSCLFVDDGYIYALNSGNTFYRLGLDGSGRTEYMSLPEKYDISWSQNWLMNGRLYMLVNIMIQTDDWGYSSVQAMVEVDYKNKTVTEIWAGEPWEEDKDSTYINVMGLWDGQIFVNEVTYPQWGHSDDDQMDYYNNQKNSMYSFNPITGQRTEIFSDTGDGFTGNTWNIPENGEIFFHSRREEALKSLNLRTGEVTVLAENVHGFLFINEERDGRVTMMRYNNDDWMTSNEVDLSMLFFDTASGTFGELTLRTRTNIDDANYEIMYIQYEEDGYYYIEVEREIEVHEEMWGPWHETKRILQGRIPIADYWASNADAIEELEWYDQEDYWQLLSEKQGWY
ncbi:MAG: hypothetical protein FWD48_03275 [Oscillospiraceae bacterium]|nr:hypothetical protein [Oscillospiraceae bacterium]